MKKHSHFIRRIKGKSGLTLVELVVSMLLVSIMMAMVVGILSPAAKIFLRMQKLQYAEQILDNVAAQLRSMTGEATQYVKIYEDVDHIVDTKGKDKGPVLEFVNPEGYVTLLYAGDDEIPAMDLMLEDTKIGTSEAVGKGRLSARYYNITDIAQYKYHYTKSGSPVARAVGKVFADGYYMGNYLQIEFAYPAGTTDGGSVTYLEATLSLYNNDDLQEEHLVAKEQTVLDLRYSVVRKDAETATNGS